MSNAANIGTQIVSAPKKLAEHRGAESLAGARITSPSGEPLKLLLDTNVLVDYAEGNPATLQNVMRIFNAGAKKRVVLYVSPLSLKDTFYLVQRCSKRALEQEGVQPSEGDFLAAQEIAAASIRHILELVVIAPLGHSECMHALSLRSVNSDFEDNLIIASAARVNADYLVSSDKQLRHNAPVACLTPHEAAALLASDMA